MKKILLLFILIINFELTSADMNKADARKYLNLPECKKTLLYWFNYFDDCRTIEYLNDGVKYTGSWKKNKFHGSFNQYIDLRSNTLSLGQFINGKKHGSHSSVRLDDGSFLRLVVYDNGEVIQLIDGNSLNKQKLLYAKPPPSTNSNSNKGNFLLELGASLLGGKNSTSTGSTSSKATNLSPSYSSTLTVSGGQPCPLMSSSGRLVKQEVVRGNRICYYQ
ncbi:hypothetical protein OAY85_00460 [Gammaproteobacteria bacterium]|nr:hypothetical protein [Gammaproteobacteria bacterium]